MAVACVLTRQTTCHVSDPLSTVRYRVIVTRQGRSATQVQCSDNVYYVKFLHRTDWGGCLHNGAATSHELHALRSR